MTRKRDMIDPAWLKDAYERGRKFGAGEAPHESYYEGWAPTYEQWAYRAGREQGEKDLAALRHRILKGTPCAPVDRDREVVVPLANGGLIPKGKPFIVGESGPERIVPLTGNDTPDDPTEDQA